MRPAVAIAMALALGAPLLAGAAGVGSSHDLGKAEGQCRPRETGPALLISAAGLKDRQGNLKLEVYPSNDADFLQDDKVLVAAGKTFRRVEVAVPPTGTPELCIRVPRPGRYAVSLLHDRDRNRKFGLSIDGIGFGGNPKLGWAKPKAGVSSVTAGAGLTRITIVMNYRKGLLSFAPLETSHSYR
jgi:uncharacterized protein (DUF2141 family)